MISYIKGTLEFISENYILVETGGIGYQIYVSANTVSKLSGIGSLCKVYTYLSVKEDGVSLFGFSSMAELDIFNKLITVSGVGPKGALGFLDSLNPSEIIIAIISEDINTLSKAPGVGKKTAQRIILDLKDKFKNMDFVENKTDFSYTGTDPEVKFETIEALTALGYSKSEAAKAVGEVYSPGVTTEKLLKLALTKMI